VINRDPTPIPRAPSRSRRLVTIIIVVAVALLLALRSIAVFWTDYLWFDSIDQTSVWGTLIFTRVWLVLAASMVAFILFWANLALADRLSPRTGIFTGNPDEELLERFQEWVGPRVRRVRVLVAAGFGLLLGLGAAVWWRDFLSWRNSTDFGITDPIFNHDISLYVFRLPFYRSLFGWAFQLFLVIALVTAALHYLNGGIEVQTQRRVSAGVKVHLSVLFAILAILKAIGYILDQWELLYSTRGQVVGASYTDVNAQLPALRLLVIISLVAAVILLVNLRFRGWTLPAVALGLWLATSLGVGGLYPALIQRFRVEPAEKTREVEFVAHNIEFTRNAYGLAGVETRPFAASADLTVEDLETNQSTIDNIRLWDPGVLRTTYSELQEIRTFYAIEDVDVDRYEIDGELTQVMVSARELDENNIPGGGWVNERLVYTHGFGAVLSPANNVTGEGRPAFFVQDIPPITDQEELAIDIEDSRIYFSDGADRDHVIAATNEREVDYPLGGGANVETNSYDGAGGIELGGIFRRSAFALRFGEVDVLISSQVRSDSKVLMVRNVRERVRKVAPFLFPDADPYLVVLDGKLVWVVDLYTVTDDYPYSALADTRRLNAVQGLPGRFNYIRNPVKAIVDAQDGTMTFYVVDESDPLIQVQQKIFPSLFTPGSEMPDQIREHLRYPEDLFRIQSDVYRLYHVVDADDFFSNVDPWQIARDPSDSERTRLRGEDFFLDDEGNSVRPMLPYYLLMRLPDDDELSFIIMQPFTPQDRPNMVSFLVAKSGPSDYGEIIDFTLPAESAQQGPGQVGDFINQKPEISSQFSLLRTGGSDVIQGNMLVVPIDESLLYVQPIYIRATSTDTGGNESGGIPEFKFAIVSFDGNIQMRESLDGALAAIFGRAPGGPDEPVTPPPTTPTEIPDEIASLLSAAQEAFDAADAALRDGDLATYAEKVAEAQSLLDRAVDLIAEEVETTAS
jgi:uncharacterized membrane protein (UPF0182 family)